MNAKFTCNIDDTPLVADIHQVKSCLRIDLVSRTELEPLWDQLVKAYHYLGHEKTIGPRAKYLIWLGDHPISAISFNQAAYKIGARDKFIDWNDEEKKKNLAHLLNNNRFLILPWVNIKNLASHILALSIRRLKADWVQMYNKEPYLLETFVDQEKYTGTCYRASNWKYIGESGGYEKVGKTYQYHGNRKAVYLYVIRKNFKNLIGCTGRPCRVLKKINKPLEMVYMQLQQNDWHPGLLEEARIKDVAGQLPEMLKAHMERFQSCFQRSEQEFNGNIYVQGLLSNLERKSIEPIALEFNEDKRGVRNLQFFMKDAKWDDQKALTIYQQGLAQKISHPEGMFTIDESGSMKKGEKSVGVARQYCGSVGKVENSQVGVYLGYSSPDGGYGLISSRLFMPEKWFGDDYEERRGECLVPEDLEFQTKPEIAMDLLHEIETSGLFQAKWVGVDSLYGNSKAFLNAIPEKYRYFADIHNDTLVWRSEPVFELPPYKGKGRKPLYKVPATKPEKVANIANDESIPWKTVHLGNGSKGPIYAQIKCVRVYRAFKMENGEYETEACWLFIRRREDGDTRFSVSNAPENTDESELCKASLMRWPIEQCFNEMKDQLGMDHVEARSWPAWHRHMLLVFIAYEFLLNVRLLVTDKKKSHFIVKNGLEPRCRITEK
jgi:SRSO17 transposase